MVLSVDAASGSACTLSGSTVTFAAVGTCVIDANQAGTATYAPAAQVQQQITVGAASANSAPVITSAAGYTVPAGQSFSFTVTTTGNPTPTLKISGSLPGGVGFNANRQRHGDDLGKRAAQRPHLPAHDHREQRRRPVGDAELHAHHLLSELASGVPPAGRELVS